MGILDLEPGSKLVYKNENAGYDSDIEKGKKYLKLNETYTINSMEIDSSHTEVTLVEIGKEIEFNSVLFECVE